MILDKYKFIVLFFSKDRMAWGDYLSFYVLFWRCFSLQVLSINLFLQSYIKAKKYPASTTVEVMAEGAESAIFKHLFKSWTDRDQTQGLGTTHNVGKIGSLFKSTAQSTSSK